jgi:hypothetical protein
MIYILGFLIFVAVIAFLFKKDPSTAKRTAQVGGLTAVLLVLLRLAPNLISGIVNLLVVFLPFIKKSMDDQKRRKHKMSKKTARKILGVDKSATKVEIKAAFNKIMKKNHPDVGGTKYLAEKIITAKKTLLGE